MLFLIFYSYSVCLNFRSYAFAQGQNLKKLNRIVKNIDGQALACLFNIGHRLCGALGFFFKIVFSNIEGFERISQLDCRGNTFLGFWCFLGF